MINGKKIIYYMFISILVCAISFKEYKLVINIKNYYNEQNKKREELNKKILQNYNYRPEDFFENKK